MPPKARRVGAFTLYSLSTFPLALISVTLIIPVLGLGVVTSVIGIGLPVLALALRIARGFAEVERRALPEVLAHSVARPMYNKPAAGSGVFRRSITPLFGGQYWLDLLYGIVILPVSVIMFAITMAWWWMTLSTLTWPLYGWIIHEAVGLENLQKLPKLVGVENYLFASVFYVTIGALFALTLPFVVRGAALARANLGRVLLTAVGELHERIADLSEGRAAAASAEAGAMRRLERDIHDGPQQRLVHLAMELSRAQRQLAKDPNAAQATITGAISETRETLEELRTLSRGIAPPVLTDRGLAQALAALAARSPVPVELDAPVPDRFSAAVENTVYFVAAEALTNVAKHSRAFSARLTLSRTANRLILTLSDNGIGGAHLAKGHGLTGLADRARSVEGDFVVHSPEGGPTVVVMEVPCG
ncbi:MULTISPECIES: sensor domain-containing protein [unclassified Streptomyces]|uniref:sensor histidine kinase n=1 Tax=unclassified Streptomyces TaxID=2593676 RepID=UPI00236549A7|nr:MULTISPECIES: sensor domain-containing protein [unclassified Streptomyces]MDF3141002.1 sensor domain-containing protein [Streptomyces sp. T21Q-yed]WDF36293.1 sensor domain-containing protein [Streptomyces sp. T12]